MFDKTSACRLMLMLRAADAGQTLFVDYVNPRYFVLSSARRGELLWESTCPEPGLVALRQNWIVEFLRNPVLLAPEYT